MSLPTGDTEALYGLHPAREALVAGRRHFRELLVDAHAGVSRFQGLLQLAASRKVAVRHSNKQELFQACGSKQHQGVVLLASPYPYLDWSEELFFRPRLLLLDNIEDPRNAGAILRSADVFGFSTVLMPLRGSTEIYPSVVKTSAGASEHLEIVRAANSTRYVKRAREAGYWITALDMQGTHSLHELQAPADRPMLVVIGGEDKRVGQYILNEADCVARIPMSGHVNSLNASVAAGIALCHFAHTNAPIHG